MKTKIFSAFIVIMLTITLLTGCGGFTPLTGGPTLSDIVTSNGGMAVQKGDYLYFVNGFINSESLVEGDNKYGDVDNAGVYRAELDQEGNLQYDEEDNLTKVELLIPKVVGFEKGGFYIFDNHIYYATPTILKDKTGTVRFDLLDFYMANLDGTGIKKIYATEEYGDSATFGFYKIDNFVYLVVFDGTQIISVKINGTSISSPVIMAESATSVALPKITEYNAQNNVVSNLNKYVYYTRALNDDDNTILELGNVLAKVQIGTTIEEKMIQDNVWNYSLGRVVNNSLYYTKYSSNSLSSKNYFRSLETSNFATAEETQLTGTYYDTVSILSFENGNSRGVVVSDGTKIFYVTDVYSEEGIALLVDEQATVLFSIGDYVYYTYGTNNRLARMNVITKVQEDLTSEDDTYKVDITLKADYDNEYIYLYKHYDNNNIQSYYLERIKYMTTSFTSEFVGVLAPEHVIQETEEEA